VCWQFVSNALHDIEIKKKKYEEELMYELESSAFLVRKAQMEIGASYIPCFLHLR
jgi:hypothetical protein